MLVYEICTLPDLRAKKGYFARFFRKQVAKNLRKQYNNVEAHVEYLTMKLENHRNTLLRDHLRWMRKSAALADLHVYVWKMTVQRKLHSRNTSL